MSGLIGSKARRSSCLIACLAGLVVLASACGSSSKPGSSTQSSGTSGSSSAAGSGAASAEVAAARQAVTAAEEPPSTIPVTIPLDSVPAKGTAVWMACDLPGCLLETDGLRAAAQAIGWNFKTISTSLAQPSSYTAGMTQALQYNPTVVFVSSVAPESGWASVIPKYEAKHIPIVEMAIGDPKFNSTVIGDVGGPDLTAQAGKNVAQWFIADSNAKGTVVNQELQELPTTKSFSDAFNSTVSSGCKGCTVVNIDNSVADQASGAIVPAVVSDLKTHPDAKYVVACDGSTIEGLTSALSAAGLGDGKIIIGGDDPDTQALAALKSATSGAWAAFEIEYFSWGAMDIALRYLEHMKYSTNDGGVPQQLIGPGVHYTTGPNGYELPFDYATAFKKLWKVS
jgi:ribose transport system substrate-binding protein